MKFTIDPEYHGVCRCGKPATIKHWTEFDTPIPARSIPGVIDLPEVKGIWDYVCEDHND